MKLSKRKKRGGVDVDMTPMIDVVFLLLVFFMTISQISEIKKEKLDLPELQGTQDQLPSSITVNVDEKGQIVVAQGPVSINQLVNLMQKELVKVDQDPRRLRIVLRADEKAKCQTVNQVVNQLSQLEIKKIRIAVRVP